MSGASDARLVEVLHEKGGRKLARFLRVDGSVVYGVLEGDDIKFLGTKAEAKRVYGTWRSDGR